MIDLRADADAAQGTTLEPLGLRDVEGRSQRQRSRLTLALDGENDVLSFAKNDALKDAVEMTGETIHRLTIHREDLVTHLDARLVAGAILFDRPDDLGRQHVRWLADLGNHAGGQQGE